MKKSFAAVCVSILAAVLACGAAFAGGPSIDKIQYKNNGSVLIKFAEQIVQSGGQSITVRDSNGRQVPAQIVKSSGRQMEIRVPQARNGEKYSFELNGMNVGKQQNAKFSNYFVAKKQWRNDAPERCGQPGQNRQGPQKNQPGQNQPGQSQQGPQKNQPGHNNGQPGQPGPSAQNQQPGQPNGQQPPKPTQQQ